MTAKIIKAKPSKLFAEQKRERQRKQSTYRRANKAAALAKQQDDSDGHGEDRT
jgi:hypothetical protein